MSTCERDSRENEEEDGRGEVDWEGDDGYDWGDVEADARESTPNCRTSD
jgi:hypothetical protein